MGRGSRHSKNAGVMGAEALTYHERKALGHGTLKERLGKDAQGNFYDCCLTLQPASDPVITSQGYIFSKEAILEYYLKQKEAKKKLLKEWDQEQHVAADLSAKEAEIQEQAKLAMFERQNIAGASDHTTDQIKESAKQSAAELRAPTAQLDVSGFSIKVNEQRARNTKSFWQPQDTPDSQIHASKPSMDVLCPLTSKKLKLKDLTPVKFTPAAGDNDHTYMDPVSNDMLSNSSKLVVIKPTGDVLLEKTYKACIKPDGMYKGHKVTDKDVIKLVGGGTGFAGREGQRLQSEKKYSLGAGSGMADLRGQAGAGRSKFGLAFQN